MSESLYPVRDAQLAVGMKQTDLRGPLKRLRGAKDTAEMESVVEGLSAKVHRNIMGVLCVEAWWGAMRQRREGHPVFGLDFESREALLNTMRGYSTLQMYNEMKRATMKASSMCLTESPGAFLSPRVMFAWSKLKRVTDPTNFIERGLGTASKFAWLLRPVTMNLYEEKREKEKCTKETRIELGRNTLPCLLDNASAHLDVHQKLNLSDSLPEMSFACLRKECFELLPKKGGDFIRVKPSKIPPLASVMRSMREEWTQCLANFAHGERVNVISEYHDWVQEIDEFLINNGL